MRTAEGTGGGRQRGAAQAGATIPACSWGVVIVTHPPPAGRRSHRCAPTPPRQMGSSPPPAGQGGTPAGRRRRGGCCDDSHTPARAEKQPLARAEAVCTQQPQPTSPAPFRTVHTGMRVAPLATGPDTSALRELVRRLLSGLPLRHGWEPVQAGRVCSGVWGRPRGHGGPRRPAANAGMHRGASERAHLNCRKAPPLAQMDLTAPAAK